MFTAFCTSLMKSNPLNLFIKSGTQQYWNNDIANVRLDINKNTIISQIISLFWHSDGITQKYHSTLIYTMVSPNIPRYMSKKHDNPMFLDMYHGTLTYTMVFMLHSKVFPNIPWYKSKKKVKCHVFVHVL